VKFGVERFGCFWQGRCSGLDGDYATTLNKCFIAASGSILSHFPVPA